MITKNVVPMIHKLLDDTKVGSSSSGDARIALHKVIIKTHELVDAALFEGANQGKMKRLYEIVQSNKL